jgi:glutamate formiminotransferase
VRRPIIECVPNFSEGRNAAVIERIAGAILQGPGVAVLGQTMDADHNRSVITFAGSPAAVIAAAVRAVSKAVEYIDLNRHTGVHPRLGAADVIPFVPVQGVSLEDCAAIAHEAGDIIWRTLGVPVYLYEAAALQPARVKLENIRRGGFEMIREAAVQDPQRRPDIGGPELHPTAGACIVGARKFLIAFNINLRTQDARVASRIARRIRESSGGLRYVKALGLPLESRRQSQVSMNLTDFEQMPLHTVVEAVRAEAAQEGVAIAGTEIIGLIPKAAVENASQFYMAFENFTPDLVLENRLEDALPAGFEDLLADIGNPKRSHAGGSAAAFAAALAAALGVRVCRLTDRDTAGYVEQQQFFSAAAQRDTAALALLVAENNPSLEALIEAVEAPLAIAERAAVLQADLDQLRANCPAEYASDAITARGLADAARLGAIATARLNLSRVAASEARELLENRLQTVE